MFILETIRLGLANLRLHLLRSILTALGIILGVAAVIIMSSLGEGSKREALSQLERLGARNIIVRSQRPPESQNQGQQQRSFVSRFGITRATFNVLAENFKDAEAIVPLKEVGSQVIRDDKRKTSQAFGTTPEFLTVANLHLARGRYLNQSDLDQKDAVAVLGAGVAREFFPLENPLEKTIRIDDRAFRVIGVLGEIGIAAGRGASLVGRDLNLDVHIPITTARAAFGDTVSRGGSGSFENTETEVAEVYIASPTRERVMPDAQRARRILEVRHAATHDVVVHVPYELLENAKKTAMTFNLVFGAIAGISLLVGGIGIMNIMLASVTERTREIGIRRAIGATRDQILWQFLVETGVLTAMGGVVGVLLGVGGSLFVRWAVKRLPTAPVIGTLFPRDLNLPTSITPGSIVLAFAVATLTGLIFGMYPAKRAAAQDPIVALRHD